MEAEPYSGHLYTGRNMYSQLENLVKVYSYLPVHSNRA